MSRMVRRGVVYRLYYTTVVDLLTGHLAKYGPCRIASTQGAHKDSSTYISNTSRTCQKNTWGSLAWRAHNHYMGFVRGCKANFSLALQRNWASSSFVCARDHGVHLFLHSQREVAVIGSLGGSGNVMGWWWPSQKYLLHIYPHVETILRKPLFGRNTRNLSPNAVVVVIIVIANDGEQGVWPQPL